MHPDMLMRDEVIAAVQHQGVRHPPLMIRMWIGGDCHEAYGERLKNLLADIPEDVITVGFRGPGEWEYPPDYPEY